MLIKDLIHKDTDAKIQAAFQDDRIYVCNYLIFQQQRQAIRSQAARAGRAADDAFSIDTDVDISQPQILAPAD